MANGEQVSELAEEQEVRDLFERFGRVTRVFLARDRETQRAKGFAFISFADRSDAARACDKMDGCTYPCLSFTRAACVSRQRSVLTCYFSFCSRLSPPHSTRRVCKEDYLDSFLRYIIFGVYFFASINRDLRRYFKGFDLVCLGCLFELYALRLNWRYLTLA